jgi:hypothetical protein
LKGQGETLVHHFLLQVDHIPGGKIIQEYNMSGMKGFAGVIPDSIISEFNNLKSDGIVAGIGTSAGIRTVLP